MFSHAHVVVKFSVIILSPMAFCTSPRTLNVVLAIRESSSKSQPHDGYLVLNNAIESYQGAWQFCLDTAIIVTLYLYSCLLSEFAKSNNPL